MKRATSAVVARLQRHHRELLRAREALLDRPRHLILGALVIGLLLVGSSWAVVLLIAVLVVVLTAGRPVVAVVTGCLLLGAVVAGNARLSGLDRSALAPGPAATLSTVAVALERPRRSLTGTRSALLQISQGPAQGERVLVRVRRDFDLPDIAPGDEVVLAGSLRPLGSFDGYQRRRGAHAVVYARKIELTGVHRGGLAGALDTVRTRSEQGLGAGLAPPQSALARGMVLGQDEALSEVVRNNMRRSGLAHLTAASGQNVLLLAALAIPILSLLGFGLRGRLLGALLLVALYVPLAGGGPSIQRAGVMGGAGLIAGMAGRPGSRWYALLLAALVTLALNPRASGDPGWQLSFAAVVAILVLGKPLKENLVARRLPVGLAEATAITVAATVATAPLLAFHFGQLSLVSLPANLLAVPAVPPIMWLGMIAGLVAQLSVDLAALPAALASYPLGYLEWLADAAAKMPLAAIAVRIGSGIALVGVYAALGLAAYLVVTVRRSRAAIAVIATALIFVAWLSARPPPPIAAVGLRVSFLDIGQGDATLIQHDGATILVDTGPPGSPILERLRRAGVSRIDLLVITHAQADHEGGAAAVLSAIPVAMVLDGGSDGGRSVERLEIEAAASRAGVRRVSPDAGQVFKVGPIELEILWPHRELAALHAGDDPNNRAIVANLRDGDFDLFLPADAESDVTGSLELAQVDVLKVAHHGSSDLGLEDLLSRLKPSIAVIEVGKTNSYGHPTAQALTALKAVVRGLYRTDQDHTVRIAVEGRTMHVSTDP